MLRRLSALILFLLVTQGHMSGSVRTLSFEDVVKQSDAVFRVERANPPTAIRTVQAGKKKEETFDFTLHRYRVKSVVYSRLADVKVPQVLEVEGASDADNFAQTRNSFTGGPRRILIYPSYRPENPRVDSLPEFLIFTRYDAGRKRFAFVAHNAKEGVDQEARIREILPSAPGASILTPMNTELQAIPFKRADGSETTLAEYAGKVVLVVNVASKCGLTPQYDGLQALYAKYKDRGFVIAGFPANEFAHQEPGTDSEIQQFCRLNYGVEFPVHAKIVVKGPDKHPLYRHLTETRSESARPGGLQGALAVAKGLVRQRAGGGTDGEITWNFEKFLIDRQGEVVARFAPDVKPEDPKLVSAIEAELAKLPVTQP